MDIDKSMVVFEGSKIRRLWYNEEWYFSVVDILMVLVQQSDYQTTRKYWNKLKERLSKEGNESVTNCHQLKLMAADGKNYLTDVANVETLLRLVQSVPSPKAEPIKLWLAQVGYERIQEIVDPEKAINRARITWQNHGHDERWIQQRMMGQETRNKLTDFWSTHDINKSEEFAILTNIIHQEWSGLSIKEHKDLKSLKHQNLRDHMTEAELIFTALAEMSTRKIAESNNAIGLEENEIASKKGGTVAKNAKLELETKTGNKIVSKENYLENKKKKLLEIEK